jgi:hypothetical protein
MIESWYLIREKIETKTALFKTKSRLSKELGSI